MTRERRRRLARGAAVATLALALGQVALIFLQAAAAGAMLTGDAGALSLHERVGTEVISSIVLVQILAAAGWALVGGPRWPVPTALVLFGLVVLQVRWGFGGALALHIPHALALLLAHLALARGAAAHLRPAPEQGIGRLPSSPCGPESS